MKHVIILLTVIALYACKQDNEIALIPKTDDFRTLDIRYVKNKELIFSQFIDSIVYISLETSDEIIVGNYLFKIIYAEQRYYVFDETKVFVFDQNGRYIFQSGAKGRGPKEMLWPTDFTVDTIKRSIEILSKGDGKINIYNMDNGKYTGKITPEFHAVNIFKTDTDKYVFYGKFADKSNNIINNLLFYNSTDNKIVKTMLIWPKFLKRFTTGGNSANSFSTIRNGTLFMRRVDNNFYVIDENNEMRIKYTMDFGKNNLLFDEKFLSQFSYLSVGDIPNCADHFNGFFDNDEYLIFRYSMNHKRNMVVYNIKNNKLFCGEIYKNDIDSGTRFFMTGLYRNRLIGTVSPYVFIKHFKKLKKTLGENKWKVYISSHPQINKLLQTVKPQDNQILMLCYLKGKFNK